MSLSSNNISSVVLEKIRITQLGEVKFKQVPLELGAGEHIDLSRWSLALTDFNLEHLSLFAKRNPTHSHLDSKQGKVNDIFLTFWDVKPSLGLVYLNISGAKDITDYGLACVARNCPTLRELHMNKCSSVGDAGLREVGLRCSQLRVLHMSSCHSIEGGCFIALADCCPDIIDLDISSCRKLQRWGAHKMFSALHKLEVVNICHLMSVGDEEMRVLAVNNPHLTTLNAVDAFNISDTGVLALSQHCFDLDVLNLSRKQMTTRITDVSLLALGERSLSLRELRLSGCENVTDVGLNWLSVGCKSLEVLDLGGCAKITDAGLRSLGSECHSLLHVDVGGAKNVSDVGVASISGGCPNLKFLNIKGLYLLSDPRFNPIKNKPIKKRRDISVTAPDKEDNWLQTIGIAALSKNCPQLESLEVSGCFRLNEVFSRCVAKGLLNLRRLVLVGCNQVSSQALVAVFESCRLLEEVVLTDCGPSINTEVLRALGDHCPRMRSLDLARCENVRGGAISAISQLNDLEKLDLSGCKALSDAHLLPMCETERNPKLKHLYLLDNPRITDTALAWIGAGCAESLLILSFAGTKITLHGCRAIKDNFPNCDLVFNSNFAGFWPKSRLGDRLLMNDYYNLQHGICALQSFCRKMLAKRVVAHMRLVLSLFHHAVIVTRTMRMYIAKRKLVTLQKAFLKRNWHAIKVACMFRRCVARRRVRVRREKRVAEFLNRKAIVIQTAYREYKKRLGLFRMQAMIFAIMRKRKRAAMVLQGFARIIRGKMAMRVMREHIMATVRVRRRKALLIQRSYRGYTGRVLVHHLREHLAHVARRRHQAAAVIQRKHRNNHTRGLLRLAIELVRRRNRGAVRLQAAIRGKLQRLEFTEQLVRNREQLVDDSIRKIQNRWRVKKAVMEVAAIMEQIRQAHADRAGAATVFSKMWRAREARLELRELKFQRDEAVRLRVRTEYAAMTKIQALFRGNKGRAYFDRALRQKKGKWKELMDDDTQKRFFYNKLTGEIRWRMPQDLLDLIPRPVCDNCERFEAGVECGVCNEFFCHACWDQVHAGGRRKDHEFRAMFDYYNKRIDYGDGNYPCKWPSEVMQDDVQGWMLRVAPMRNPAGHYGDWEHYTAEEGQEGGGENFYFNRRTFEATYETPPELLQDQDQQGQGQSQFLDGGTYDQTYDHSYDQTFDQTYDPGASALISNRDHDYSSSAFDETGFVTAQYSGDQMAQTSDSSYSYYA